VVYGKMQVRSPYSKLGKGLYLTKIFKEVGMAKKILVVDDKQELRSLLKSYLSQEGFEVVLASNGQEARFGG